MLTAIHRARTPLHNTHPAVAQVWRNGARQERLAAFLKTVTIHPLDDGKALGQLLALARTTDVVDAHLVIVAAHLHDTILAGDPDDLNQIADTLGTSKPTVRPWPEPELDMQSRIARDDGVTHEPTGAGSPCRRSRGLTLERWGRRDSVGSAAPVLTLIR
jgi:hypothetical protein